MKNVTLFDHRGEPIRVKDLLREHAAPQLTGVRRAWDADSVSRGLTPDRLARILRAAAEGDLREYLILAEEMEERDPHYASVLGTRKRACTGLPPTVEAASDETRDQELADAVRDLVAEPEFTGLLADLLDGLGKGFAACEIVWERGSSQWRPRAYEWRDPKFFVFDRETGRELRLADIGAPDGLPLPPYKFIVHTPRLKSGLAARGGLARLAATAYMCKSYTLTDWLAFAEVFGMPLRLGRYGANASEEDVKTLVSAVANLGTDAAAVLPDTMRIDFQEAGKSTGGQDLFQRLADWLDRQVSKAVLGQTMTTDDGSSLGQAKVHNEVRLDILRDDGAQLAATINRDLVRAVVDLNFGPPPHGRYPRLTLPVREPEDIAALTDALAKLSPLGLRVEASVARDRLGFPDPAEGAEVLAPGADESPALNRARRPALNRAGSPAGEDLLADLAAEGLAEWEPQMAPILDPLEALAARSASYEEFLDGLPGLITEMDAEELVRRLARAAFLSRGLGMAGDD